MIITNDLFRSYISCKHKALLKYRGEIGSLTCYEKHERERESEYKANAAREMIKKYGESLVVCENSLDLFNHKLTKSLILSIKVTWEDIEIEIDALESAKNKPSLRSFDYIPFLFTYKNKIGMGDKLLLAFQAYVLKNSCKIGVKYGKFVYGQPPKYRKLDLCKFDSKINSLITKVRELSDYRKESRLLLNKHCSICEYQKACENEAKKKDDLSLIRSMKEKEIIAQNNKGIFTVSQYSYTFRPRKAKKRIKSLSRRRYHALQALAIREQKVFVYQQPSIPNSDIRIFMDVETKPDYDFIYLIGLVVEAPEKDLIYSFWADSREQQNLIIDHFLGTVKDIRSYLLFHYGSPESKFLLNLKKSYSGKYTHVLDTLVKRSVNVLSLIFENFYFPVYENSLKSIAGYLGYKWSESTLSGLNSIVFRSKWEKTKDDNLKDRLLRYNIEDCYAVKKVLEYLNKAFSPDGDLKKKESSEVTLVGNMKCYEAFRFKKNDFIIQDFEYINRCAYFDYQRDKVFVRTNRGTHHKVRADTSRKKTVKNPNKIIELKSIQRCPYCGCRKIYRHDHFPSTVTDLRFLNNHAGVKRWGVRYIVYRYRCTQCRRVYAPKTREKLIHGKYGQNLIAWIIYQNVSNGLSFIRIQRNIKDIFGLSISRTTLHRFKSYGANYYLGTYKKMMNKIIESPLIHVDETQFNLSREAGYIWVLTNTKEVVFVYQSTRGGEFIKNLLRDFDGILVSDFYALYDSFNCPQQKCLIHLIRDFNSDLYKNPFDEELKCISQEFGSLLKMCVETIDKYGLRKRHLRKHIKDVKRFYRKVINRDFSSEVALQYQKRIQKNRDKLFTFLSYDGVPWNNNNVEHAIKHLATYRRMVNGILTERGINEYLILLSIYQTCNYKQQSFLDYLLSRKREIP